MVLLLAHGLDAEAPPPALGTLLGTPVQVRARSGVLEPGQSAHSLLTLARRAPREGPPPLRGRPPTLPAPASYALTLEQMEENGYPLPRLAEGGGGAMTVPAGYLATCAPEAGEGGRGGVGGWRGGMGACAGHRIVEEQGVVEGGPSFRLQSQEPAARLPGNPAAMAPSQAPGSISLLPMRCPPPTPAPTLPPCLLPLLSPPHTHKHALIPSQAPRRHASWWPWTARCA